MIYLFRCPTHGIQEVKQPLHQYHESLCPICNGPTERVYSPLAFQFGKVDYNKDGSRDLNPDLPIVPSGTKWTHGWSPKKETNGKSR